MTRPTITVLTGAGISAESGLATFRGPDGLWRRHRPESLATPEAFARDPELVLDFYNTRRGLVRAAQPSAAHQAIADLESAFDVTVITQNVDDLHERAGSSRVLHVHGEILWGRSAADPDVRVHLGDGDITMDDRAPDGSALRPDVVWFGESVRHVDAALSAIAAAKRCLVVGTSLTVYPVAAWIALADTAQQRVLIAPEVAHVPSGFQWVRGKAGEYVPSLCKQWLEEVATGR